jgi:preprotein translocase subunit SecF
MNQVLLRSLNTSVVAILPVLSMLLVGARLLGAVTLEEFAVALLVGMISGAYSSIFVAAPIVVWLKEREPRNQALAERIGATRASGGSKVSRADLQLDDEPVAPGPASGSGPGRGGASTGQGPATRPVRATPTPGTIPPRPRKKGKKR